MTFIAIILAIYEFLKSRIFGSVWYGTVLIEGAFGEWRSMSYLTADVDRQSSPHMLTCLGRLWKLFTVLQIIICMDIDFE